MGGALLQRCSCAVGKGRPEEAGVAAHAAALRLNRRSLGRTKVLGRDDKIKEGADAALKASSTRTLIIGGSYNSIQMLLYYITDRKGFAGTEAEQQTAVLRRIADAARAGVDYIQLREKDLRSHDLESLAREAVRAVRENSETTRLLINRRTDIALACGADGVHLASGELRASEVRSLWKKCSDREPTIGVSAHSLADVQRAKTEGANFVVLAPIFEKVQIGAKGIGLRALGEACSPTVSGGFAVLALGGVNAANVRDCLQAGAGGVAGIRLFQSGDVRKTVRLLRKL